MGECVLVVDDEPHSREMHAEALRIWGYEAVVAQDGFEALQKVSEHSVIDHLKTLFSEHLPE
jgi:CheY-like chemotaxis protein